MGGIQRRSEYFEEANDDKMGQTNTKKRMRSNASKDVNQSRSKKRKISSKNAIFGEAEALPFVPINVCQLDKINGSFQSALHHCVMTEGPYNASFENETMAKVVCFGSTLRTNQMLKSNIDLMTPYKHELTEEE